MKIERVIIGFLIGVALCLLLETLFMNKVEGLHTPEHHTNTNTPTPTPTPTPQDNSLINIYLDYYNFQNLDSENIFDDDYPSVNANVIEVNLDLIQHQDTDLYHYLTSTGVDDDPSDDIFNKHGNRNINSSPYLVFHFVGGALEIRTIINVLKLINSSQLNDILYFVPSDMLEVRGDIRDLNTVGGLLPHLIYLSLSYNQISGDIRDFDTSTLGNLQYLDIGGNQISGDIHNFHISVLGNLKYLDINANQIGGNIRDFDTSALGNLQYLDINANQIGGNIHDFHTSALGTLISLYIGGNQISGDIHDFDTSNLGNLEYLDINDNQIGGNIRDFDTSALGNLEYLDIGGNQISGVIGEFHTSNLVKITHIGIDGNQISGDIRDFNTSALGHLKFLSMAMNQISGVISGFDTSTLVKLQYLDISTNNICGDIKDFNTTPLRDLKYLNIGMNMISGNIADLKLGNENENLTHFIANNNMISGDIGRVTRGVIDLVDLDYFDLSGNALTWYFDNPDIDGYSSEEQYNRRYYPQNPDILSDTSLTLRNKIPAEYNCPANISFDPGGTPNQNTMVFDSTQGTQLTCDDCKWAFNIADLRNPCLSNNKCISKHKTHCEHQGDGQFCH